jgi:hypothetical protein
LRAFAQEWAEVRDGVVNNDRLLWTQPKVY